ncbi:unnamed protein product [Soboliphyme baturini]|uniref:RUN domain-containing protein n=1 Tax=Soboliphyme baturini TaxID=241478 RepID=A0A183IVG6_9BILA|nr:unnamed protein product [Soboliphyme baturini]
MIGPPIIPEKYDIFLFMTRCPLICFLQTMSEIQAVIDRDSRMLNVKQLLQMKLLESLNKCQANFGTEETAYVTERNCNVLYLLSAVESVLLHGLRKQRMNIPVLREVTEWMSKLTFDIGLSVESEDGLWEFLKKVLDSEIMDRFEELQQVSTNIGRIRSWLRSCFNESCFEEQFGRILGNQLLLSEHYESWAFLRDVEMVATLPQIARGIDAMRFCLATDSDSLNSALIDEFREIAYSSFCDTSKTPSPLIVLGDRSKETRPVRRKALVNLVSLDSSDRLDGNSQNPVAASFEGSVNGEDLSVQTFDSDCISQGEIGEYRKQRYFTSAPHNRSIHKLVELLDSIANVKADLSALKADIKKYRHADQCEMAKSLQ